MIHTTNTNNPIDFPNSKFTELADQATGYCDTLDIADQNIYRKIWQREFAELIVRECADIAGQEDFDVMMKEGYPCSQTAKKIKEHFGVE